MYRFRSLDTAKELYQKCKQIKLRAYAKTQLCRAALSVCLNLAEGSARRTTKDRIRMFNIALASLREVQTLIWVEELSSLSNAADKLGTQIYKLINMNSNLIT